MGFDNYTDPLRIYLQKYRDALKSTDSSASKKQKLSAETSKAVVKQEDDGDEENLPHL